MSDISDFMDADCEKLKNTVHGISTLHSSIFNNARSPSPKNSYMEFYQMSTQAMARKKTKWQVSLKTLPPCTRDDCNEHKILTSLIVEESNFKDPTLDEINVRKVKKKKPSKKRKNKGKESSKEFIFPKKTARPVSPTSTQDPIETKNNFSDLEQDVEHPLPTVKNVNSEEITPSPFD
ncbi:hypothetical protein TNCV_3280411 [Trichonephila clavipes]|nr:hypothetical protein TNCV_3280411 [Trichonephila clavipes]